MNRDLVINELLKGLDARSASTISAAAPFSKSQYCQDIFALSKRPMTNGFFVKFGASYGVQWSNTWLLEKHFGWKGILAEPARVWHYDLARNRTAEIDTRCVYSTSGIELDFLETKNSTREFPVSSAELSGLEMHADNGDWASKVRIQNSERYKVKTVSLNDLLFEHHAPKIIDYLSIDTEGSELECLASLDFKLYTPLVITIEHNRNVDRQNMYLQVLSSRHYLRVHPDLSGKDDWYIHRVLTEI